MKLLFSPTFIRTSKRLIKRNSHLNVKLLFSPTFIRTSKRLIKRNSHLKMTIQATLKDLESDLFNPNLRTHKLKGRFEGYWSCSVTYDIRILFKIVKAENEDAILLQTIGTHDEVY